MTLSRSRRQFLQTSTAYAVGFCGLQSLIHPGVAGAASTISGARSSQMVAGYGKLIPDPEGLLSLPRGFSYKIISETGQKMDDGLLVAAAPDGMATFAGPDGLTVVVRNHETLPTSDGPYGPKGTVDPVLFGKLRRNQMYDDGRGKTPSIGGTTTFVYDTEKQELVRQFQSLAGTIRNCAGGPTPWGSWITCEETMERPGVFQSDDGPYLVTKSHGYNFEVPATAHIQLAEPIPLVAMGRFRHEAVAVDPQSGVIYETEDMDDGAIYRFLPHKPGLNGGKATLRAGGRLQALKITGHDSIDTRNWEEQTVNVGDKFKVEWVDINHPESPDDDLRYQAYGKGAARFARGEGMWYAIPGASGTNKDSRGSLYFACTSGGKERIGQIWKYTPSTDEGQLGEASDPGTLELFIEPNDSNLIQNADNLTVAPWGDLVVCEDRYDPVVRLVGVTPSGECYTFAQNHVAGEFAGVTFSPDGSTLFVNLQTVGKTVAITGPWHG